MKDNSITHRIRQEQENDKICECGREMKLTEKRRKWRKYRLTDKTYHCECGLRKTKRTSKEIMRDLGIIE